MIRGIGMDLVEIDRVQSIMEGPSGERFVSRVLTAGEQRLVSERKSRAAEFVAGRFAAKEAVVKALGTGISATVGLQDVEVLPDQGGRPTVVLSRGALERLGYAPGALKLHLSITHTRDYAAAYAVAETADGM
ncbi:holo-ACP synthase [Paenibacillus sp. YN15]|uniref:holo-ACP synthase n=1 Tax=Paenibacillus sp. YN15 TaxID=1742774 RepID=UPI000DCEB468|nr:holo-ACP synthase [Paenibacillus sp. YN15]RAU92354.1 holo-[acyl-carrier-protein] synthase [Paenibacillus sp. YN15]